MWQPKFNSVYAVILLSIGLAIAVESPCGINFWCSNNGCAPRHWVCDGLDDCGDNSDERSCEGCRSGEFSCGNGDCIEPRLVCDRSCDCDDDCVDETGCYVPQPSTCHPQGKFLCSNGHCTYTYWVCDSFNDCGDLSDERSCEGCSSGNFSCGNNTCIDPLLVCDRTCDCDDNCVDEMECYYDQQPPKFPTAFPPSGPRSIKIFYERQNQYFEVSGENNTLAALPIFGLSEKFQTEGRIEQGEKFQIDNSEYWVVARLDDFVKIRVTFTGPDTPDIDLLRLKHTEEFLEQGWTSTTSFLDEDVVHVKWENI